MSGFLLQGKQVMKVQQQLQGMQQLQELVAAGVQDSLAAVQQVSAQSAALQAELQTSIALEVTFSLALLQSSLSSYSILQHHTNFWGCRQRCWSPRLEPCTPRSSTSSQKASGRPPLL